MRILVTGGCGFIGSHVVERMLKAGYDVRVLGLTCNLENVEHLVKENRIEFLRGDVADPEVCKKAVRGCEMVSHIAALVSVDHSILDPRPFWEVNVEGTFNILDAAKNEGVRRFHLMSSCEMLGHIEPPAKANEDWPHYMPRSPYAASKLAAETYCRSYYITYGFPIVITRGFNVFGPRQRPGARGAMIASFITRVLDGKPPVINGDGEQTRDWTFVQDVANGIFAALTSDNAVGETIHLCNAKDHKVKDVAQLVIDTCGKGRELKPQYKDARAGEMRRSIGDNSKAKRLLNWEPKVSFEEGVSRTVEFFRQRAKPAMHGGVPAETPTISDR
jgi:UDP-N-acetylglucosamine/UDP-N-acetyl-alpha-D-glucosaminouronate 4-epimerase